MPDEKSSRYGLEPTYSSFPLFIPILVVYHILFRLSYKAVFFLKDWLFPAKQGKIGRVGRNSFDSFFITLENRSAVISFAFADHLLFFSEKEHGGGKCGQRQRAEDHRAQLP
ncbi:MAG: hypothetical protein J5477_03965 [Schwartzia sp.]|nr:hypothetical protein [Schwartzia sp. (in: firmicutes)]